MNNNFPIDYIVPMVFPGDPHWQSDLRRATGGIFCNHDNVRYRSWDNEDLLIQCIRQNLPWLRNIIIILARESQVQPWMTATTPSGFAAGNIRLVFHRDFMPPEAIPTFNSRCIEMFLYRIPGIADHFLYANDDMFPLTPLRPDDFFAPLTSHLSSLASHLPCQHMTPKPFPQHPNNFQTACMGGLNFVASEFGLHFTDTWLKNGHGIAPILKSSCEHLWHRAPDRIMASLSPFREPKNFNQYIYAWYQHFSGQSVDHTPRTCLLKAHTGTPEQMVTAILDPQNQIVCINDHEACTNYRRYATMVADAINQRLNH